MIHRLLALLSFVLLTSLSMSARADELGDFETARAAYDAGDYATARVLFEAFVAPDAAQPHSATFVLEARKYLASACLFLNDTTHAEEQLTLLVRADRTSDVDPVAFPRAVVELFRIVRTRVLAQMRQEEDERRRIEEEARVRSEQARRLERERLNRLQELATEEVIETHHSRWIAAIPFGIGQFQNGHDVLGIIFATTQGVFLATSIVTFWMHQALPDRTAYESLLPEEQPRASSSEATLTVLNYSSLGLFAALAISGIIDAQVRFVPVVTTRRQRELPPELQPPSPTVALSPLGLSVRW